jgi:uncharacterized protein YebE (UPF0316 family)
MLLKLILVFLIGLVETFLYAGYILSVTKKQVYLSSILMLIYMTIYLSIITFVVKDINTFELIIIYALSCGIGNFIRIKREHYERN